jgi:hypothetical protein
MFHARRHIAAFSDTVSTHAAVHGQRHLAFENDVR